MAPGDGRAAEGHRSDGVCYRSTARRSPVRGRWAVGVPLRRWSSGPSDRTWEGSGSGRSWKGCKPNSVPGPCGTGGHHSSRRPVPGTRLLSQHRRGPRRGSLFGLAPGEVFRAPSLTRRAVGSYPAFSPLPHPCGRGGLFSVALSVARSFRPGRPGSCRSSPAFADRDWFPRPRALWSSDFPPATEVTSDIPPFQDRSDPRRPGVPLQ